MAEALLKRGNKQTCSTRVGTWTRVRTQPKSFFAGLALGLGLGGSASKSFFQVLFCAYKTDSTVTDYLALGL